MRVSGVSPGQAHFLRRIFDSHHADTFGIERARSAFYRAVSPGRFRELTPHAAYTPQTGLFTLELDATMKRHFDLSGGGYLTSSTNSFLYLSGGYTNITTHYTNANLSAWIGQSYMALTGNVTHGLSTSAPMTIGAEVALTRQKFYENERLLYETKSPSFITNSQFYARLKWAHATSRRSKVELAAGYGHLWDSFYPGYEMNTDGASREHTRYHLGQLYAKWEMSTLDNPNYPVSGTRVTSRLDGIIGNIHYEPSGAALTPEENRLTSWATLRAEATHYFRASTKVSVGLTGQGGLEPATAPQL